jgi:DNA uptake protein ComE-like DNA-binding protein
MAAIVEYLAANFGKVNVNAAGVRELGRILELSEKEAQAIAGYRERNGKIKDYIDQCRTA